MTSDLWRLSCSEQCTKLTRQALGPLERPEIRQAICMVKCVMLVRIIKIDVSVTWRITAISYFPRYIGNKAHTQRVCTRRSFLLSPSEGLATRLHVYMKWIPTNYKKKLK